MRDNRPMAFRAMVLLFLTAVTAGVSGCGAVVYESVADGGAVVSAAESVFSETSAAISESAEHAGEAVAAESNPETLLVYVCGAVERSGVYELPAGSRIYEAVAAAGGLAADADETALNQAEMLADGMQITVLTEEQAAEAEISQGAAAADGGTHLVNINTAGAEELMTLRGIGESRAADIIAYREAHGPFGSIEDIMQVSGIKTALFNRIRDGITVG